jgi:hypothetical protein
MLIFVTVGSKMFSGAFIPGGTFPISISDVWQSSILMIVALIFQLFTMLFINVHHDLVRRIEIWQRCVTFGGFAEGQLKECVGGIVFKRINLGELRI